MSDSGFVPATGHVGLFMCDTGEFEQWLMGGYEDDGEPWEKSALELALDLVPALTDAIDRGRVRGKHVQVAVTFLPAAGGSGSNEGSGE